MEAIGPYIPLIVPLLIIQLALMVIALSDLRKQVSTRGPRWLWLLIIVFVNLIGPILYFVVGKEDD
jgi:hypothetical protein